MTNGRDRSTRSLARLLAARAGLRLTGTGGANDALVERAAQRAGASSVESYAASVAVGIASIDSLVEEARVGETYFFREPHQLAFLERRLFQSRQPGDPPRRLWSAGCASGEETYTLAMMASEADVPTEILGTDVSELAIAAARHAEFVSWSLRGPQKDRARSHLVASGGHFEVNADIRRRVSFGLHNLVAERPPAPASGVGWDAILCRNVLIYFDAETQARVIETLANALAEGGWLLLGSCDPPAGTASLLEPIVAEEGVFYRRRGAPLRPSERVRIEPPEPPASWPTPPPRARRAMTRASTVTVTGPPPPNVTGPPPLSPDETDDARATCLRALEAIELGDRDGALVLLRRALFLEPGLVVAELATASLFERGGDPRAARRGYRRALRLASGQPEDAEVPLASGATYADLVAHCRRTLATLGEGDEA